MWDFEIWTLSGGSHFLLNFRGLYCVHCRPNEYPSCLSAIFAFGPRMSTQETLVRCRCFRDGLLRVIIAEFRHATDCAEWFGETNPVLKAHLSGLRLTIKYKYNVDVADRVPKPDYNPCHGRPSCGHLGISLYADAVLPIM